MDLHHRVPQIVSERRSGVVNPILVEGLHCFGPCDQVVEWVITAVEKLENVSHEMSFFYQVHVVVRLFHQIEGFSFEVGVKFLLVDEVPVLHGARVIEGYA